jgi:threonine dehydratase
MIDHYYANGDSAFAISSSGNAALAAALHVKHLAEVNPLEVSPPITLDIFVGNHIDQEKLKKLKALENDHIRVLTKERPLQALTLASQEGIRSLRQSTDDEALVGYESLAQELAEMKDIGAVFIGTSSGTTAQALSAYFSKNKLPIQVHIVQTSSCHPIGDAFGLYEGPEEPSIADAIVGQVAHRKSALVPLIQKTGGFGWTATNEDIETALELTEKYAGLNISTNSALSVAGAMKAVYAGYEIKGAVVCLICGN